MNTPFKIVLAAVALAGPVLACTTSPSGSTVAEVGLKLTGTVVVVNQQSDSITLIDLAKMEAYKHVGVVGAPHEAAVSPDGKTVAVTNYANQAGRYNKLSIISLPAGETLKTIDLGQYSMPHDIRWVNGSQVVCTSEANNALLLVNVDSGKIDRVFETESRGSHMLALSTDQKRLYCSNMGDGSVTAFDFQTGRKIKDVVTGAECEGVGVSPDGRWVWAGNRAEDTISIIDTESLEVVKKLDSPGFPYRVQFTPNGKYALVPHARSSSLVIGSVEELKIVKTITLGGRGVSVPIDAPSTAGVFAHPDNVHAFVTIRNDNSMVVLNLETGETLARVPVQNSPDGVAYSPVQR